MKTIYVHPAVMKRIMSGNYEPVMTRTHGLDVNEVIEVADTDGVSSVITKVAGVERRGHGLYRVTLKDHATAFMD